MNKEVSSIKIPVLATLAVLAMLAVSASFVEAKIPAQESPAPVQKKTRAEARASAIVLERAEILQSRWDAFADRLEKLSGRIDSHLQKLEEKGFDGTTARTLLETANDRIAGARVVAEDTYNAMIAQAEKTDGTGSNLRKIENEVINPGKETVNAIFERAKGSLIDVLKAIP